MKKTIKHFLRIFLGSWSSRNTYAKDKAWFKENEQLQHLNQLDFGKENVNDKNAPIFIFSAGWRSGSTLLQRLILSSEDILMWGEPFDKVNIVESMSASLIPFSEKWPQEDRYFNEKDNTNLSNQWVASLYPSNQALKQSHRHFFDTLFDYSAADGTKKRWGVKEVRWGKREALYLKWLYPNAKFIFLVRNPYNAYQSFKAFEDSWYAKWPKGRVYNAYTFTKHWNRLVSDFFNVCQDVSGIFVKYEDIISKEKGSLDKINNYLNINIDENILNKKIGSSVKKENPLLWVEKLIIRYITKNNFNKLY